jgi:hypothetical protein
MALIPDNYSVNIEMDNATLIKIAVAILLLIIINWALNHYA